MRRKKRRQHVSVLMVTSEVFPLAKEGGLADAVSALARELDGLGNDIRIIMPRYYSIGRERLYRLPSPFTVRVGHDLYATALYEGRLEGSSVVVYFLDFEDLYGRDGVYGSSGVSFGDNLKRFALLSHAALRLGRFVGWEPQIIHAHDWPAALTPFLAQRQSNGGNAPATILTIHNVGHQGSFPVGQLPDAGIEWSQLAESGLLHYDELNMMKSGITHADVITTVSKRYAEEIQTPRQGFSLDQVLAGRRDDIHGILNGVDYSVWNPERDSYLDVKYTTETVALKGRVKESLQRELALPVRDDVPLVGLVSRLVDQKGLEELVSPGFGAFPDILTDLDVQVVVLGSGDPKYEYYLRSLARRYENLAAVIGFDERLAHLIEGASDFFLMPSRYEPCGLNQLYSLRYGTLPIVTRTGGFVDSVEPVSPDGGTGFFIDDLSPRSVYESVMEATRLYVEEPARIDSMRRAAMKARFNWADSAVAYLSLYQEAVRRTEMPAAQDTDSA
jgi:starch synthase